MANKHAGECPYCGESVTPVLNKKNVIRRDVCSCPSCSKELLICRTPGCHTYAKGGQIYDDELCPNCTSSLISGTGEILKWGAMAAMTAIVAAVIEKKK
jgi:hypothetical protein